MIHSTIAFLLVKVVPQACSISSNLSSPAVLTNNQAIILSYAQDNAKLLWVIIKLHRSQLSDIWARHVIGVVALL